MNEIDYEQLYYDLLYENKKLKNEIENLKIVISINDNSDLIKFIVSEVKNKKAKEIKK